MLYKKPRSNCHPVSKDRNMDAQRRFQTKSEEVQPGGGCKCVPEAACAPQVLGPYSYHNYAPLVTTMLLLLGLWRHCMTCPIKKAHDSCARAPRGFPCSPHGPSGCGLPLSRCRTQRCTRTPRARKLGPRKLETRGTSTRNAGLRIRIRPS